MAEKLSKSDFQNIQSTVSKDVFSKITSYLFVHKGRAHVNNLYVNCFSLLQTDDFIKRHIYYTENALKRSNHNDLNMAYTLLLLFIYISKVYSKELQECINNYYFELCNFFMVFVPKLDDRIEFHDFAKEFGENMRRENAITNTTDPKDINSSIGELTKEYVEKLQELYSRANKDYEDKIKELEDKLSQKETELTEFKTENSNLQTCLSKLEKDKESQAKKFDINDAYCEIAVRYMNANRKKAQNARESKKNVLIDIMSQLNLVLPEDIRRRINNFDDEGTPPQLKLETIGEEKRLTVKDVTSNSGPKTKSPNNGPASMRDNHGIVAGGNIGVNLSKEGEDRLIDRMIGKQAKELEHND